MGGASYTENCGNIRSIDGEKGDAIDLDSGHHHPISHCPLRLRWERIILRLLCMNFTQLIPVQNITEIFLPLGHIASLASTTVSAETRRDQYPLLYKLP